MRGVIEEGLRLDEVSESSPWCVVRVLAPIVSVVYVIWGVDHYPPLPLSPSLGAFFPLLSAWRTTLKGVEGRGVKEERKEREREMKNKTLRAVDRTMGSVAEPTDANQVRKCNGLESIR